MSHRLLVIAGPDQGQNFPVTGPEALVLGRGRSSGARLGDPSVSRVHCEVKIEDGRVVVADLGSASGTFVNGTRVRQQSLQPGDVLQIGVTRLRLEAENDGDMPTLLPPKAAPRRRLTAPAAPAGRPAPLPVLPAERLQELSGKRLSHYQLGPVLARGHSGILFWAHDDKHNRETALKVLWPHLANDDEEVQRFLRTMRTILPLRHPNLVALYGAGRTQPYCWFAMEYVQGKSLTQVLARAGATGPPRWPLTLRVLLGVGRALAFAHGRQVIHRNLTPQNILIRGRDRAVKLGDLMLAKALEGSLADPLTRPGEVLGDILYMAPERTTGGIQASDARADLYSLGANAYLLLTGRPPLQGSSFVETVLKIRKEAPVPPRKLQPAAPALLEETLLRLLAKRPEDRFQTAEELLRHLEPLARAGKGA